MTPDWLRRPASIAVFALVALVGGVLALAPAQAGTRRHRPHTAKPSATAAPVATASTTASATVPATSAPPTSPGTGGARTTVTYPASDTSVANPERGFAHLTECQNAGPSATTLASYRTQENITVLWCMYYLSGYRTTDIAASALTMLDSQFAAVRTAGLKMVLRFAYTQDEAGNDATPSVILRHIAQLKPHLRDNADVILAVQAGFVGAWGEWYYTKNFGDSGSVSASDQANRRTVLDALLDAVPDTRMVQLRTPAFKRGFFGTATLPSSQAYGGTAQARVGFHNDCFLASDSDMGTYGAVAVEKAYLADETASVVMGGETCAVNPPRSQCATALGELGQFHWTFLNTDYNTDVVAGWKSGGCYSTMQRRLGYQIVLQQGSYPVTASRTSGLPIHLALRNDGFAAPVTRGGSSWSWSDPAGRSRGASR